MKSGNRGWIAAVVLCGFLGACGADETTGSGAPVTVAPPAAAGQGGALGAAGQQAGAGGIGGQGSVIPPATAGSGAAGAAGGGGASGQSGGAAAGTGGLGAAGMAGGGGSGGNAGSPVPAGEICEQWKTAHANLSEGAWTGNTAGCEAGDMTPEARAIAHSLHSLYRSMAGLAPVEMTDEGNRLAQGCALLMAANNRLSHMPDSSWTCYTEESADTASKSSLSPGGAISSVGGYMIDPGNPTTLGHRRWILSSMLASVGFGSSGTYSCQYQPPQRPEAGAKPWVAWPPAGQIPIQAFGSRFSSMDQTGWSVQSDSINLGGAQVAVTSEGANLAVTVTPLSGGYGSTHALRFNPMGWTTAAGKTYSVSISGTSMPIEYDVEVVDCQ